MNIKRFIFTVCLMLTVFPAWAARPVPVIVCRPDREAIITLNVPAFGAPTIWDAQFADKDGQIRFFGGMELENGDILAAGQMQDVDFKPLQNILVEIDKRARVIDDKNVKAQAGEQPVGMISLDGGHYIVASTILTGKKADEKGTRLVRYDHDRHFKSEIILKDSIFDYEAAGLTPLQDGKGYLVWVHAINRKDVNDEYGIIFRINNAGQIVWKRAYRPGVANQIYGVSAIDERHFLAGGRVRNEDGRMAGWLMELNDDGTIVWQNTYPRGQTAIVRAVTVKKGALDGDHYVAVGQVMPYGEVPGAAWLMELDSTANIVWQRYVRTTSYNLDARAVYVEPDGRMSVMANATVKSKDEDGSNHIRLLSFSPRGDIMSDEAYMQGRRAEALQFIPGRSRERLVIATIDAITDNKTEKKETAAQEIAKKQIFGPAKPAKNNAAASDILRYQGWMFAATPLPPYKDPCVIESERVAP